MDSGLKILLLTILGLSLTACGSSDFFAPSNEPLHIGRAEPSLESSWMKVSWPNLADGLHPAVVTIVLKSKQGQPIIGASFSLAVSGSGNQVHPCTTTDVMGQSICKVYSTQAEGKRFKISGPIDLEEQSAFLSPDDSQTTAGMDITQ